ncbi:beta and beta-prime subunits of DNA dependent RNA-polymerase [Piedraia hortae CBS 480.64]|uniref:DNA-directed RNA polymerase subunit beta n=1 Tax=Piedraia hortae CBS 480.64 TaxID=1314780 RepID=A0A6A7C4T5_9PEZI|nr:beta and beta-prime subunits of DNA dependent RNA-polymerase [Piedraia hortae CBS 480.64]
MVQSRPQNSAPHHPKWTAEYDTTRRQKLFRNPPNESAYPALLEAIGPHVDSFNAIFAPGGQIEHSIKDIGTKTFLDGDPYKENADWRHNRLQVRIKEVSLGKSVLPSSNMVESNNRNVYPAECRERAVTYRGRWRCRLEYSVNGGAWKTIERELGNVPIMLRSNKCHLQGLSPRQLVVRKEETEELGGYFVVNGVEKLIRMLIVNRRNFPMAIERNSFEKRGKTYTKYGVQIRSVRPDQTSQTNVLHYLSDGNVTFRFSWRKNEYLVPVLMIIKALRDTNDREIYEGIMGSTTGEGLERKQFVTDRMELLLRTYKNYQLHSRSATRTFLGEKFRIVLGVPEDMSDYDSGTEFLRKVVLPHLGNHEITEKKDNDKYQMLLFMIRKLYALVEGECATDNPDAVSSQEILLPGTLYGMIMKERLEEWLISIGGSLRDWKRTNNYVPMTHPQFEKAFLSRVLPKVNENLGQALEYFLATGNLVSPSGLDLQQTTGFTVVAEKINFYRFISHFRMVHRGSFFAQLKTTTVRKLLPESWGFLCPVHTPDGSPCGLLNHLAHKCKIVTESSDVSAIPQLVAQLGVDSTSANTLDQNMVVQLNGRVLGFCRPLMAKTIADTLRYWKVEGTHGVPLDLEIGHIPESNGGQYPGVYMFSSPARMIRPAKYLPLDKTDLVGPFEQPFMSIACTDPEITSGDTTHVEYAPTNILSIVANQTPFPDFNQSPRNMYQCLSVDHEVLTNTGWKALSKIRTTDQVMTMNLQTGTQQWNVVEGTTRFPHDGPLYRLKSGSMDAVCDENHRWYLNTKDQPTIYRAYTTQQMLDNQLVAPNNYAGKNQDQWSHKSGATTHINHKIPTVGHNGNAMYLWTDCPWLPADFIKDEACNLDWCRFVGLVMGEGGINHTTNAQGQESWHIIIQCAGLLAVQACIGDILKRLAARISNFVVETACVSGPGEKQTWTINNRDIYNFFLPMMRGPQSFDPLNDTMRRTYRASHYQALTKSENEPAVAAPSDWETSDWWKLRRWMYYPWLYSLSQSQARAIIAGKAITDNMSNVSFKATPLITGGVIRVIDNSIPLVHDLSVLGHLADMRVKIAVKHSKGDGVAKSTGWIVSFTLANGGLAVSTPKPELYENPRHDGFVYCLTVPNGNFLARRTIQYGINGEILDAAQKPFYTGNCQMGKQTMGTPGTALQYRTDNKLYKLQCGQTPVVRPPLYNEYGLDNFPNGTNAVVAVLAYTGYDMDDAMIINKSSHERGFGHGTIYKTKKIDLFEEKKGRGGKRGGISQVFGFAPRGIIKDRWREMIDNDGLARVGAKVKEGDIIAVSHSVTWTPQAGYENLDGVTRLHQYKDSEEAYIDDIRLVGNDTGTKEPCQTIIIRFRIPRQPVIGDKFSSRHGQKGVCSQKWPAIDMPFTESGMQPDIIINPHAFPSRMTIGMFIESMAGKSGALHGLAQDCTPFKFKDKAGETAAEYFGHQLRAAGYNYYGNEPMYSGITGEELAADVFIGVVYYQRLRHMVNDKFQVRTTGPVTPLTGQPIKGRSKGGGIRVGEMERDSLLAHGTAFLLQDRLMNCSDYTKAWLCRSCGSFLSVQPSMGPFNRRREGGHVRCRRCSRSASITDSTSHCWMDRQGEKRAGGDDVRLVAVPGVLRYLDVELSAMGVRLRFEVEP